MPAECVSSDPVLTKFALLTAHMLLPLLFKFRQQHAMICFFMPDTRTSPHYAELELVHSPGTHGSSSQGRSSARCSMAGLSYVWLQIVC